MTQLPDYPSLSGSPQAEKLFHYVEQGKVWLRDILDAPQDGDVIQDLSASRLLFSLADAAARVCRGSYIVTTELDHPASIDGAARCAEKYNKKLVVVPVDQKIHSVTAESVLDVISQDTGVLMLTCTSNTTGAILPYEKIVREARKLHPDLFIILDGVQRAPHGPVNLSTCPADALVIAPYKMFSSRGSGLAWISERMNLIGKDCLIGHSGSSWELGSIDPISFGLMSAVGEYLSELGTHVNASAVSQRERIRLGQKFIEQREQELHTFMLEGTEDLPGLRHIPGVQLHFDQNDLRCKDWIVSITSDRIASEQWHKRFLSQNIVLSLRRGTSIFCGTLLKSYGTGDVLRISPMHYHQETDIRRFLQAVIQMLKQ